MDYKITTEKESWILFCGEYRVINPKQAKNMVDAGYMEYKNGKDGEMIFTDKYFKLNPKV